VRLLDAQTCCSVNKAVDELNRGIVHCPEGFCITYSTSNRGYYLLYVSSQKHAAFAALGVLEPKLTPGMILKICSCTCQVTKPLGMGSFGAVWAAELLDGSGEVAIKEILCRTPQELANATFEGNLLRIIHEQAGGSYATMFKDDPAALCGSMDGGSGGTRDGPLSRIPALVATEVEAAGADVCRVRLVMTKVQGAPLDRFLEGWQGASRGRVQEHHQRFMESCHFARELILQLAPTLERVSAFAYHRDVNSHNILVSGDDLMSARFALVDFGLAVDVNKWQGQLSPTSWHLVDIGGDCRYWPMSAWLQFECGWQEVSKYPPLLAEYRTHLDLHAMGITALQVLATMCPRAECHGLLPEFQELQRAWEQYWEHATCFWRHLLEVFRHGGDQNALKIMCITEGVHNIVGADLAALRAALRKAADACQCGASAYDLNFVSARLLFFALLELVSAGGMVGCEEGSSVPSWQAVLAILDMDKPHGGGTGAPPEKAYTPAHRMPMFHEAARLDQPIQTLDAGSTYL